MSAVKVFRCGLSADILSIPIPDSIEDLLPEDFYSRCESRRVSFYTGRLLLAAVLSAYYGVNSLKATDFLISEHGKPFFSESFYLRTGITKRIYFNLSHSGKCLCLSISDEDTATDIERRRQRKSMNDLALKYFSDDEKAIMAEDGDGGVKSFFSFWTIRETLVKYSGRGLSDITGFKFALNRDRKLQDDVLSRLSIHGIGKNSVNGDGERSECDGSVEDNVISRVKVLDIMPTGEKNLYPKGSLIVTFDCVWRQDKGDAAEEYAMSVFIGAGSRVGFLELHDVIMPEEAGSDVMFLPDSQGIRLSLISRIISSLDTGH